MKHKYLLLALLLPSLLTGCSSDLLGTKPEPKPKKVVAKKAEKKHVAKPSKPTDNPTTTYAIDDGKNEFKVEAINPPGFQGQFTSPEPGQQPVMLAPSEQNVQGQNSGPTSPTASGQSSSVGWATAQPTNAQTQATGAQIQPTGVQNQPTGAQNQPTGVQNQATGVQTQLMGTQAQSNAGQSSAGQSSSVGWAAAQPTAQPTNAQAPAPLGISVEDVVVPASASPAVFALSAQADASQKRGDLDGAVVITERALRIDSRNPIITYKLALLRLKQNKPQLAEDLAGKAALLAGSDLEMKRKSWLLIAEARQNQQNFQGAKEAKNKAESFFGR